MKKLLTPALVAVATAAGLLAAPAAGADTLTVRDAKGDVRVATDADSSTTPLGDTRANADVLRVKVAHGAQKVRVRVVFDDLVRDGDLQIIAVKLRTPRGRTYHLDWISGAMKKDLVSFIGGHRWADEPCRGLTHAVDPGKDVVSFTVPRRCLERPASVRFKAWAGAAESIDSDTGYVDRAGTDRWAGDWSKAVRRG